MKTFIIFIVVFLAATLAFGQNAKKNVYKVRAKGRQLVVTYQGKAHAINASEQIDAAKITSTKLLFANRKDNFTYLVIDVFGWSRDKQNDRQCGAGEEANLIWIKLDEKWRVDDIQSERYESCWSSANSEEGYKIKDGVLSIKINNLRDDKDVILYYYASQPEKGFQIKTFFPDKN